MKQFRSNCLRGALGLFAIGLVLVIIGSVFGGLNQTMTLAATGGLTAQRIIEVGKFHYLPDMEMGDNVINVGLNGYYENDSVAKASDVKKIELDLNAVEFDICTYSADEYKLCVWNVKDLSYEVEDGVLKIQNNDSFQSAFKNHLLTLYIPESAGIDEICMDVNACNGKISGVSSDIMDLNANAVSFTGDVCKVTDKLKIDTTTSNIHFKDADIQDIDVSSVAGNVCVTGSIKGNTSTNNVLGNIDIDVK